MTATYNTAVKIASDEGIFYRCIASAAQEGQRDPIEWTQRHIWHLATQPGWGDAWEYALNIGRTDIGDDDDVISDAMILASVQAIRANPPG